MAGVFTAENAVVEIYLDDGAGAPSGSALQTLTFKRVVGIESSNAPEFIPHLGHPAEQVVLSPKRNALDLEFLVDGRAVDLSLSDALYYIRVITHTDDFSSYDRYNCQKCRRTAWSFRNGDVGPTRGRASFSFESWESEAV